MSAVIRRFDKFGVLLEYYPDRLGPHHSELQFQPSDRLRCLIVRAERELKILEIIVDCLAMSDVGVERVIHSLRSIECALTQARSELGMYTEAEDA